MFMRFFIRGSAIQRRFSARLWSLSGLIVLFCLVDCWIFRHWRSQSAGAYLLALLPGLPVLGVFWATGLYLKEEKDEFERYLMVLCLLGGAGGALALTTIWGYLEAFTRVPRIDLLWVYPLFWLFFAISVQVVKARYAQ